MSPEWAILLLLLARDVLPPVPHYYSKGKKARVLPTHCRQCGARLVLAPQAYTKIFCNVDCKKAHNRAVYAASKLSRIHPFTGAVGAASVREGTN